MHCLWDLVNPADGLTEVKSDTAILARLPEPGALRAGTLRPARGISPKDGEGCSFPARLPPFFAVDWVLYIFACPLKLSPAFLALLASSRAFSPVSPSSP